jgi:hypothetical protein
MRYFLVAVQLMYQHREKSARSTSLIPDTFLMNVGSQMVENVFVSRHVSLRSDPTAKKRACCMLEIL